MQEPWPGGLFGWSGRADMYAPGRLTICSQLNSICQTNNVVHDC